MPAVYAPENQGGCFGSLAVRGFSLEVFLSQISYSPPVDRFNPTKAKPFPLLRVPTDSDLHLVIREETRSVETECRRLRAITKCVKVVWEEVQRFH
jgi:hypothetical protein